MGKSEQVGRKQAGTQMINKHIKVRHNKKGDNIVFT
jgi:hypothetical protein